MENLTKIIRFRSLIKCYILCSSCRSVLSNNFDRFFFYPFLGFLDIFADIFFKYLNFTTSCPKQSIKQKSRCIKDFRMNAAIWSNIDSNWPLIRKQELILKVLDKRYDWIIEMTGGGKFTLPSQHMHYCNVCKVTQSWEIFVRKLFIYMFTEFECCKSLLKKRTQ